MSADHERPICESAKRRVNGRILARLILPAVLGAIAGFLALAWAIPAESSLPASLVALFSPGLKIAEMTVPAKHESLAFTFGWFLRIAILANAGYYFAIFALAVYLLARRRKRKTVDAD